MTQWEAKVNYRLDGGNLLAVTHPINEIFDLHDLVESGPHWDTIASIVVVRVNHVDSETLTVEEAEKL